MHSSNYFYNKIRENSFPIFFMLCYISLDKKLSFPLRNFSVNVIKSTGNCGNTGNTFTEKIQLHFLCSVLFYMLLYFICYISYMFISSKKVKSNSAALTKENIMQNCGLSLQDKKLWLF